MNRGREVVVKPVYRNLLFCLVLGLFPLSAVADYLDQIERLYENGASSEAYELARANLYQGEGDPRFDLYYGLAAVDNGFTSEGIFALERLVQVEPNNYQAHLGLARAYQKLGHRSRAREELQKIVAGNPSPEIRAQAQTELDRFAGRAGGNRPVGHVYFEMGAGYDSNINGGMTDDTFGPIFTDDSYAQEDGYVSVAGGVFGSVPLTGGLSLFGVAEGYRQENFDTPEFNIGQIDVSAGLSLRHARNLFQLALLWQDYEVGHDPYRTVWGARGEWRHEMENSSRISFYLEADELDYDDDITTALDSRMGTMGIGWSGPVAGSSDSRYFVTLYGGVEREREDPVGLVVGRTVPDRDLYGLRLGTDVSVASDVRFDFTMQAQWSDYREPDEVFSIKRDDDYYYFGAGVTWQFHKNWKLRGSAGYTYNDSNISIYDYDRTQAGLTLRFDY
jgi:tetratricopeptide (TPR) repeat protein